MDKTGNRDLPIDNPFSGVNKHYIKTPVLITGIVSKMIRAAEGIERCSLQKGIERYSLQEGFRDAGGSRD